MLLINLFRFGKMQSQPLITVMIISTQLLIKKFSQLYLPHLYSMIQHSPSHRIEYYAHGSNCYQVYQHHGLPPLNQTNSHIYLLKSTLKQSQKKYSMYLDTHVIRKLFSETEFHRSIAATSTTVTFYFFLGGIPEQVMIAPTQFHTTLIGAEIKLLLWVPNHCT